MQRQITSLAKQYAKLTGANEPHSIQQALQLVRSVQGNLCDKRMSSVQAYCSLYRDKIKALPKVFTEYKIEKFNKDESQVLSDPFVRILSCSLILLESVAAKELDKLCQGRWENQTLLREIRRGYLIIPYHNFTHAVSLQLMLRQCMSRIKLQVSGDQLYVLQLAALGHDLGHLGFNNSFYVKSNHQLSKQVEQKSVLECMHFAKLKRIISDCGLADKLEKVTPGYQKSLLQYILATDMAHHKSKIEKAKVGAHSFKQALFHACDISNPVMPFDEYISWSRLLAIQFRDQYLLQGELKLVPSPMLLVGSEEEFVKGQIFFSRSLCLPLWQVLAEQQPSLSIYVEQLKQNLAKLQK